MLPLLLLLLVGSSVTAESKSLDRAAQNNLKTLISLDKAGAKRAYEGCRKAFGADGCQIPCKSIAGCAGCGADSSVCAYCFAGHILSADKKTCQPCPAGTVSKGGLASTCDKCDAGMTTNQPGSHTCVREAVVPPQRNRKEGALLL